MENIEEQVEQYKERHDALFNNNHAVMLLIDPVNANILDANPAACKYYGYSREELLGKKITEINTLSIEEIYTEMEAAKNEKRNHFNFKHRLANGEIRDVEVYSGPIKLENKDILYSIIYDITERKKTEKELQYTKDELERFFTVALDLLAIASTDGKFIRVNKEWETTLGYSVEELTGVPFLDFIHPDDVESTLQAVETLDAQKPILNFINRYRCKDGSYKFIEWRSNPHGKTIYAAARDITEYVEVDRELRDTLSKLQEFKHIINRSPIIVTGVSTKTTPWSTAYISENVKDMVGYTAEEFLSGEINWPKICHPDDLTQFLKDAFFFGESNLERWEHEYRVITKSGEVKWFRSHDHWSNSDPSTQLIEVIVVDITDRKKDEEKIKTQFEEMSRIVAEKDKFFSIISHDLRSPFLGFIGYSQIIAEKMNELPLSEIQTYAIKLQQSAKNLYELLENLLNWSLIQRNTIKFEPEPIQIDELIKSVVKIMEIPASKKELEIIVTIEKPLAVYADKQMLNTIARNLLSNSIKFTNRRGRIEIKTTESEHNFLKLCFQDTGVGMSKELINNLFRLDIKTSTTGTEGEPSTGLGLILCKEYIEKIGGKLEISSEPGKGSCFCFTVPKFEE